MRWFEARGVELGAWFDGPLSPLPDPDVFNYVADHYPSATAVAEQIVNLPSHNRLSSSDVDRLIALVESYAAEHPLDREPFAQSSVLY
jgi:dTDP-4-amino-4,6-dideoxygalactose transaminase